MLVLYSWSKARGKTILLLVEIAAVVLLNGHVAKLPSKYYYSHRGKQLSHFVWGASFSRGQQSMVQIRD